MKRVGFPGIEGAFSDEAGRMFFGDRYDGIGLGSFEEVCRAVKEKKVQHAVLPIENSSTGSIGEVFDLIEQYDLMITGEKKLFIEHHLLALPDANPDKIECIYSHPQAFKQCYESLKKLPPAEQVVTATTANGARIVNEKQCLKQAALGSRYAAQTYGLDIIREGMQDKQGNATRFLVLSDWAKMEMESDKISLSFVLKHEPGALAGILSLIASGGYNVAHIESRPIRNANWAYRFFLDIEGSLEDLSTTFMMKRLRSMTEDFRIVGQYRADMI